MTTFKSGEMYPVFAFITRRFGFIQLIAWLGKYHLVNIIAIRQLDAFAGVHPVGIFAFKGMGIG
jgi:hypothetical protein